MGYWFVEPFVFTGTINLTEHLEKYFENFILLKIEILSTEVNPAIDYQFFPMIRKKWFPQF